MQPVSRHDLALLFIRALAVFSLYAPFLSICSIIATAVLGFLFGPSMNPADAKFTLIAFWHLLVPRLIAAFFLWRFAPPIARWISTPVPIPADTSTSVSPRTVVAGATPR